MLDCTANPPAVEELQIEVDRGPVAFPSVRRFLNFGADY